jgi:hypothetical protein
MLPVPCAIEESCVPRIHLPEVIGLRIAISHDCRSMLVSARHPAFNVSRVACGIDGVVDLSRR